MSAKMHVLHICCNLAGSTVFPQMFEALRDAGLNQTVFVPEKRAENLNRNRPHGVLTHCARTVRRSDALFFPMKARRTVPGNPGVRGSWRREPDSCAYPVYGWLHRPPG